MHHDEIGRECFQQDGARARTARNVIDYFRQFHDDRLIRVNQ